MRDELTLSLGCMKFSWWISFVCCLASSLVPFVVGTLHSLGKMEAGAEKYNCRCLALATRWWLDGNDGD